MTHHPANKGRKLSPEVLTDAEVQRLIRACSHRARTGLRNRALIVALYRGGLRIREALDLYPKDLDPVKGTIRVLNGKGKKARTIGLDPASFAVIQLWMDERKKRGINGRAPVFCTLRGERVKTAYVRALFKRLAKKAGDRRQSEILTLLPQLKMLPEFKWSYLFQNGVLRGPPAGGREHLTFRYIVFLQ